MVASLINFSKPLISNVQNCKRKSSYNRTQSLISHQKISLMRLKQKKIWLNKIPNIFSRKKSLTLQLRNLILRVVQSNSRLSKRHILWSHAYLLLSICTMATTISRRASSKKCLKNRNIIKSAKIFYKMMVAISFCNPRWHKISNNW